MLPSALASNLLSSTFPLAICACMGEGLTAQFDKILFPDPFRDVLESELPGSPVVNEWKEFDKLFANMAPWFLLSGSSFIKVGY